MSDDYPECTKMTAVAGLSNQIGDFLDWLNEQGIHLARYQTQIECGWEDYSTKGGRPIRHCREGKLFDHMGEPLNEDCERRKIERYAA